MRALALAALLALSLPAQAQLYKCVDAKGRTHYTDKPLAGCRAEGTSLAAPRPGSGQAENAAKRAPQEAPQAAQRIPTAAERARTASECKGLREQLDWLHSPRGKDVPNHAARVGQVEVALRGCP